MCRPCLGNCNFRHENYFNKFITILNFITNSQIAESLLLMVWISYSHLFWTVATPVGEDSIGHFCSVDSNSDIITSWLRDFGKYLYLLLWIGYDHQICTAVASLKKNIRLPSIFMMSLIIMWLHGFDESQ